MRQLSLAKLLAGSAVLALAVAGCGGTASVSSSELSEQAQAALTQQDGQPAPPVDCPGDLPAEVGAKITCTISDGTTKYEVYITVTSVEDGDQVKFDVQVADTPVTVG